MARVYGFCSSPRQAQVHPVWPMERRRPSATVAAWSSANSIGSVSSSRRFASSRDRRSSSGRDFDPGDTGSLFTEEESDGLLEQGVELLDHYQSRLAAQDTLRRPRRAPGPRRRRQGQHDPARDERCEPQGVVVHGFRQPSDDELDHDYLWRYAQKLPARGQITIFNRSHYEEVLVVARPPGAPRAPEAPPDAGATTGVWQRRYRQINDWERFLVENGFPVVKLFLNLSKEEQRPRFLRRIDTPEEELEVQRERRQGAGALGRVPGRLLARCSRRRARSTRRGT